MATITSDTFLDGGTARTAGESWTINGGILTIRTDTRYHANAPASMTGSLGATTISATLGGGVLIDATDIREVWFDSGSGNVPAYNTTISQGSASGLLIGVYSALNVAPTTPGSAMPASGYILIKQWNDVAFTSGALTGISASCTTDPEIATYKYFGFLERGGTNWRIMRKTLATNAFDYATGTSDYATAWTARASQTYT